MNNANLDKVSGDLLKLLLELHKKIFNQEELVKGLPMPPSHVKVIFHLAHRGPSAVSHIAHDLGISKPNMTPIIDKLISEGYVNRYEDPKDRRILRVELTSKACELFENQKKRTKDMLSTRISVLSEDDLKLLHESVENLSKVFGKL
ncbi:MarR family transcriptional regulator [Clostridium carnis]